MSHLSPSTLTRAEQESILRATAAQPRDHAIYSLALGTGLRLAEIVGLNVGDIYSPDGTPRSSVRIRPEIAKGGRGGDVFVADGSGPQVKNEEVQKGESAPTTATAATTRRGHNLSTSLPRSFASLASVSRRPPEN